MRCHGLAAATVVHGTQRTRHARPKPGLLGNQGKHPLAFTASNHGRLAVHRRGLAHPLVGIRPDRRMILQLLTSRACSAACIPEPFLINVRLAHSLPYGELFSLRSHLLHVVGTIMWVSAESQGGKQWLVDRTEGIGGGQTGEKSTVAAKAFISGPYFKQITYREQLRQQFRLNFAHNENEPHPRPS